MIKPILKIELPNNTSIEEFEQIEERLRGTEVTKEYHIIVVSGTSDYITMEIITASDINLHLPPVSK